MKRYLVGIWRSLPIQLFLLHFRRYQVFLIFWYILFSTVAGHFMFAFGANSLYLAPEYLGEVTPVSTGIVGFSIGVFIMSWNITTFILHSKNVRFLATTAQPFLKYCINNAILPLIFLVFYFVKAVHYARYQELLPGKEIFLLVGGFAGGIIASIMVAFVYFFGADKTIYRSMGTVITDANSHYAELVKKSQLPAQRTELAVDWFLSAKLRLRKPRDVRHYSDDFLNAVFKRHHFAAVIAIAIAFLSLILVGFTSDAKLSQIPAAASITVFFAILIAVAGALALFLHTWAILVLVVVYMGVNVLYQKDIIDLRNKAYGLDYVNKTHRPMYDRETIHRLVSDSNIEADKKHFIGVLNKWKARQKSGKPVIYIINTTGGGARSAVFTMNTLQRLDSMLGGDLMNRTILISGASGGMLGAAYFRELYLEKIKGAPVNLQDRQYVDNISKDLLSPLFASFVTRDMIGPVQKFTIGGFTYAKDRGYAFEQKLNENTHYALAKTLNEYVVPESEALIPTMLFNSTINRDGRKMVMSTHPVRYLMLPRSDTNNIRAAEPDAIDFNSFFQKQGSLNVNVLSALRMNATFPYVLPNVWLPTNPVIDVMDAGLRDNFGQEASLRFIEVFKDWLKENTSEVVLLQIRDRTLGDWDKAEENSLINTFIQPLTVLQSNWQNLQDYYQRDQLEYLFAAYGPHFHRVMFQYLPSKRDAGARLSFHLTTAEKIDIASALDNPANQREFERLKNIR